MGRIFMREMKLAGWTATAADKYGGSPEGPCNFDVQETYGRLEHFLMREAQPADNRKVKFTMDGMCYKPNAAYPVYIFNQCLVTDELYSGDQVIQVASIQEQKVDKTLTMLKGEVRRWQEYWHTYKKKVIEVPGVDDAMQLIPHIPQIFKESYERWK